MKKKLTKESILNISDNFSEFMDLVNKRSEAYFRIYVKHVNLGSFEDIESIEILDERVLATVLYWVFGKTKNIRSVSVDFPVSYLWDDKWEEKAEDHVKEYSMRRESYKKGF